MHNNYTEVLFVRDKYVMKSRHNIALKNAYAELRSCLFVYCRFWK